MCKQLIYLYPGTHSASWETREEKTGHREGSTHPTASRNDKELTMSLMLRVGLLLRDLHRTMGHGPLPRPLRSSFRWRWRFGPLPFPLRWRVCPLPRPMRCSLRRRRRGHPLPCPLRSSLRWQWRVFPGYHFLRLFGTVRLLSRGRCSGMLLRLVRLLRLLRGSRCILSIHLCLHLPHALVELVIGFDDPSISLLGQFMIALEANQAQVIFLWRPRA